MKKIITIMLSAALLLLSMTGCFSSNDGKEGQQWFTLGSDDAEDKEPIQVPDSTAVSFGTAFLEPYVDGKLYYTVRQSNCYQTLSEANINKSDLIFPHNLYPNYEIMDQYREISDYLADDDTITDTHTLLILDVLVNNQDAVGMTKKTEFLINSLQLFGGDPVTIYYPAYFSEAGLADASQPYHYRLAQGEQLEIRLGFLVQKDDIKNVIGVANETVFQVIGEK